MAARTPNILSRLWHWINPPKDIWRTVKTEYLRDEKVITCDWIDYSYYKVYAVHQESVNHPGKTRIVESWVINPDRRPVSLAPKPNNHA